MKLLFVGDIMLGRLVNEVLKRKSPTYPWGNTLPIFKQADLKICNLECVISDRGAPWPERKAFYFRCDSKNIEVLKVAGIDHVSLTNNHVLDYDYEGLLEMMRILSDNGINFAGCGTNFLEASEPAICEIDGKKIGLIAFTDNQEEWEAKDDSPGIFYVPINPRDKRAKNLFEIVKQAKKEVNFLIVSAHWGPNWGYEPPKEHIPFAHALINSGADIIFGHSGHVFRGVEIYKNKPIIYCAGDFIDDYAVDELERNDQSFIFLVEVKDRNIRRLYLYPTVIRDFQAQLAKGIEIEEIILKMQRLCTKLKTETFWQKNQRRIMIKT